VKYRSKVVEIEARQFVGIEYPEITRDIIAWTKGSDTPAYIDADGDGNRQLYINTLEGTMRASDGDYIIRGLRGEHYPCKPDVFLAKYELVK